MRTRSPGGGACHRTTSKPSTPIPLVVHGESAARCAAASPGGGKGPGGTVGMYHACVRVVGPEPRARREY